MTGHEGNLGDATNYFENSFCVEKCLGTGSWRMEVPIFKKCEKSSPSSKQAKLGKIIGENPERSHFGFSRA